jgi:hypothetical protein
MITRAIFWNKGRPGSNVKTKQMFARINKDCILESWLALIGSANGRSEEFYRRIVEDLASFKVPHIVIEQKDVATSFEKLLFGKKRPAILVTNRVMTDYKMFIVSRDYGNQLTISWYLVSGNPIWRAVTAAIEMKKPLDLFQLEELSCWITTVHHSVVDVTKEVAESVNFDFAKVDTKSKGFLNVT